MSDDPQVWANQVFEHAYQNARAEMAALRGQLITTKADRNSRAVFPMSDIYLRHISGALDQCLDGVSNRYLDRGKKWKLALEAVERSLGLTLERGPEVVASYLSTDLKSAKGVAENHFRNETPKLVLQVNQRRYGWTGEQGKRWHDRHPVTYAIFLLLLGATVGKIIDVSADIYFPVEVTPQSNPAKP